MHFLLRIMIVMMMLTAQVMTSAHAELKTAVVKMTTVPQIFRLDGVVEAVNQSTLSAQTSGQVTRIYFDVEDYVEKGSLLLTLKDTEQQANLDKARANLKAANAQLQDATEEHERIKGIYAKKLVAKSDMDKAVAALNTAKAQHQSALAALDQAVAQLNYTRVVAPYSGIVTKRHIEVGEIAQPGMPLMSGISLDKLRVVVDVPQSIVVAVRHSGKAMVQSASNGWIPAEKLTIFPYAESGSNSFKVRLDLPSGVEDLLPGMFVKAAFVTGNYSALVVPREAVVYRSEVVGVYVIGDNERVNFRHIRVGNVPNSDGLIVLSGLQENERVALDPIQAGALLKKQRASDQHNVDKTTHE